MKTKLTLTIEKETKERAKGFARRRGISVSQMVERFLNLVSEPEDDWAPQEGSMVHRLMGSVPDSDPRDYDEIIADELMKKYEKNTH